MRYIQLYIIYTIRILREQNPVAASSEQKVGKGIVQKQWATKVYCKKRNKQEYHHTEQAQDKKYTENFGWLPAMRAT